MPSYRFACARHFFHVRSRGVFTLLCASLATAIDLAAPYRNWRRVTNQALQSRPQLSIFCVLSNCRNGQGARFISTQFHLQRAMAPVIPAFRRLLRRAVSKRRLEGLKPHRNTRIPDHAPRSQGGTESTFSVGRYLQWLQSMMPVGEST